MKSDNSQCSLIGTTTMAAYQYCEEHSGLILSTAACFQACEPDFVSCLIMLQEGRNTSRYSRPEVPISPRLAQKWREN